MRILYIHNNYSGDNSGEEHAAENIVALLQQHGHIVDWYRPSSTKLIGSWIKQVLAFFTGLWNPRAVYDVKRKIKDYKPDIVQIQNLYPLISPAILFPIKRANIPIIMRTPNYRLFCPNGLFMDSKGLVCEKCLGNGRELHCIIKNCERSYFKSAGYALRNFLARKYWGIFRHIDKYIVQTEFQKNKFFTNGIPLEKLSVIPGFAPPIVFNRSNSVAEYVSFIGRISSEKGIEDFLEAAKQLPNIPFKVVGSLDVKSHYLIDTMTKIDNVEYLGFLNGSWLNDIYSKSRIIVVPSKCYEGFPNVIVRAMQSSKPVITYKIGAMTSIIDHEKNGILVPVGNIRELTESINQLFNNIELCQEYGNCGYKKAQLYYSSKNIYKLLYTLYLETINP